MWIRSVENPPHPYPLPLKGERENNEMGEGKFGTFPKDEGKT
jgi:hypothetical protein